jgi:hypothetical protein
MIEIAINKDAKDNIMIKNLIKLREYLEKTMSINHYDMKTLDNYIDAIEHEIYTDYIEYPKDKNGVRIYIGDTILDRFGKAFTVYSIELLKNRTWLVYGDNAPRCEKAHQCTHPAAPSIQDTLRNLINEYENFKYSSSEEAIIQKYSKYLQLIEDE